MAAAQRIEALSRTREEVKALIRSEEAHPWVNERELHKLKVRNLHMKDEIERLRQRTAEH